MLVTKSYRDLESYKLSYDLAVEVHRFSLTLPQYEMYEEGSQVRKSSKGITSCIAEGYGRKKYKAEFIKFLVYPVRNNAPLEFLTGFTPMLLAMRPSCI